MELISGVRIFDHAAALGDRVELSAGLRTIDHGSGHMEGGVLPRGPWRRPASRDVETLRKRRACPTRWTLTSPFVVAVVDVREILRSSFCADAIASSGSADSWASYVAGERYRADLGAATRFAAPFHTGDEPITPITMTRKEPGLTSVAYDPSIGELVGLHFDNFERRAVTERHLARNRLVINTGTGPRHLLFVNLPLGKIRRLLGVPVDAAVGNWSAFLLANLVRRFPTYPVLRLRVDPGEAYIAATDHLIHDGSTELGVAPDLSLHFLGRFVAAQS